MIQNMRKCTMQGHEFSYSSRICTFKDCNQYSRWVCAECIVDQIHQHRLGNQNHIMKQDQFKTFIQGQLQKCVNNEKQPILQQCIIKLNQILSATGQLIDVLQKQFQIIKQNDSNEITQLLSQATNDFLSIDRLQISKLFNYNFSTQFDTQNSQDLLQSITNSCSYITQIITKTDEKKQNEKKKITILQQSSINYTPIQHEQEDLNRYQDYYSYQSQVEINALSISPNQKQIAFGGKDTKLIIVELSTKKVINNYQLEDNLQCCIYNSDSTLLFCGDKKGHLYCLSVNQNFKIIYKNNVHSSYINDIKLISNDNVITCSTDLSIIITDVKYFLCLLEISNAHDSRINQIEFDHKNETIISCSNDKVISIKIFNLSGQLIISQKNPYFDGIFQIQLVDNNKLLSRSTYSLILWQIDYRKNQLVEITELASEEEDLCFFYSVLNNTRILKISPLYLQIIDYNQYDYLGLTTHCRGFFHKCVIKSIKFSQLYSDTRNKSKCQKKYIHEQYVNFIYNQYSYKVISQSKTTNLFDSS
ncbi:hypothetical protein pb186bvf_016398 [Paramecium bursaria]